MSDKRVVEGAAGAEKLREAIVTLMQDNLAMVSRATAGYLALRSLKELVADHEALLERNERLSLYAREASDTSMSATVAALNARVGVLEGAAQKVVDAHLLVIQAVTPGHENWCASDSDAYSAVFSNWHAATRELRAVLAGGEAAPVLTVDDLARYEKQARYDAGMSGAWGDFSAVQAQRLASLVREHLAGGEAGKEKP
jgi:hypothetical protein